MTAGSYNASHVGEFLPLTLLPPDYTWRVDYHSHGFSVVIFDDGSYFEGGRRKDVHQAVHSAIRNPHFLRHRHHKGDLPPRVVRRYRREGHVAELQYTQVEVPCACNGRPSYRWAERLALMDPDDGSWLYSEHWSTRATKKSHEEITALGWEEIP